MTAASKCTDPVVLNLWHPVGAVVELVPGAANETQLLGGTLAEMGFFSELSKRELKRVAESITR